MKTQEQLKKFLQYLIVMLIALSLSLFVVGTVMKKYHPVIVSGSSMEPTYSDGNILVSTVEFEYKDLNVGDVIVFKTNKQFIKRIIAKAGDIIWIKDGIVYVNGKESEYQFENIQDAGILNTPYTVEENELFCLGDNRNHSNDCRNFGSINFDDVRFKIVKKIS